MRQFIYQNSLVNGCRKDGSCWEYRYLIQHKGIWQDKVSWRNQSLQNPSAIYHKELVATLVMVTGCSTTLVTPENKMSDRDVSTRLTQEETTGSLCIYWCVLCVTGLSESRFGQIGLGYVPMGAQMQAIAKDKMLGIGWGLGFGTLSKSRGHYSKDRSPDICATLPAVCDLCFTCHENRNIGLCLEYQ